MATPKDQADNDMRRRQRTGGEPRNIREILPEVLAEIERRCEDG